MQPISMSSVTATQATTKQQLRERLAKHLIVNGQPVDDATLNRIVNAKPKPAPKGNLQTRGFSLLR